MAIVFTSFWASVYSSFAAAISASRERLAEVSGLGTAAITEIKIAHAIALRMLRSELQNRPLMKSTSEAVKYCSAAMRFETREQTRILFLDVRYRLIADEIQGNGTIYHTPVYVRES